MEEVASKWSSQVVKYVVGNDKPEEKDEVVDLSIHKICLVCHRLVRLKRGIVFFYTI